MVYSFARDAITKYLRVGDLKNRKFSQFWRLKSKMKVTAVLVLSETSHLGLQMAISWLCHHTFFVREYSYRLSVSPNFFLLQEHQLHCVGYSNDFILT